MCDLRQALLNLWVYFCHPHNGKLCLGLLRSDSGLKSHDKKIILDRGKCYEGKQQYEVRVIGEGVTLYKQSFEVKLLSEKNLSKSGFLDLWKFQ